MCFLKGEIVVEYKLCVNYFVMNYFMGLVRIDIEFVIVVLDLFGNYKLFNKLRLISILWILFRREYYLFWVFLLVILE